MKYQANILVVDDEAAICRNISTVLQGEDLQVDTAFSGEEAMEKEAAGSYALAVVDMMMPGMSGIEFMQKVKERNPDLTIIMITGYPSVTSAVQAIKMGAFDYMTKPFTPEQMRNLVSRALERRFYYEEIHSQMGAPKNKLVHLKFPPHMYCIPENSWVRVTGEDTVYVGIHHILLKCANNIVSLDFPKIGDIKSQGDMCISITDTRKRVHHVWLPVGGKVVAVNEAFTQNYTGLYEDPYNEGWLLQVEPTDLEQDLKNLKSIISDNDLQHYLP